MPKRKLSSTSVVQSSGNVFADLGLPDAEEKQTKVRLAVAINQIIEGMGLSQTVPDRRRCASPSQPAEDLGSRKLSPQRILGGTIDSFLKCAGS